MSDLDDLIAWLTQVWREDEDAIGSADPGPLYAHHMFVLNDIKAKRSVRDFVRRVQTYAGDPPGWDPVDADALGQVLKLLASAYVHRPGYREEWKP